MSEPNPAENLSNHHVRTINHVFAHPLSHNVEWPDVLSLLGALGSVEERHNGKYAVTVGDFTTILERGPGKTLDATQIEDVRQLLSRAGFGPLDRGDVIRS